MNTDSDDMVTLQHIPKILQEAAKTFSTRYTNKADLFNKDLQQLVNLFNNTTSSHVNLPPMFMDESTWVSKTKAPMTYIHIFSDNIINVGIFILKPQMKLPLHNHPEMFGLLKVIAGTVKITSYSLNTAKVEKYLTPEKEDQNSRLQRIIVEQMDDIIANSASQCCVLDANNRNIHEIESINGPAAFIDILSPPYDVDIPGLGERKCSYFRLEKQLEPKVFELREINTPSWFWSDSFPYTGPTFVSAPRKL